MDFWKNLRIHVIVLNRVLGVLEADDSAFFYTCSVNEVKNMNIAEIAKMAGVSSAAVSRYFNNGYISEESGRRLKRWLMRPAIVLPRKHRRLGQRKRR